MMYSTKKKTKPTYKVKELSIENLLETSALQRSVIQSLPNPQKSFVRFKPLSVLAKYLVPPHGAVGVFTKEDELVGAAFLTEHEGHAGDDCWALCPFTKTFLAENAGHKIGVIGGVMVSKDHGAQGIMKRMLATLILQAEKNGFHDLVAAVGASNEASIKGFETLGFSVEGADKADSDGRALVFFRQKVSVPMRRSFRCVNSITGAISLIHRGKSSLYSHRLT